MLWAQLNTLNEQTMYFAEIILALFPLLYVFAVGSLRIGSVANVTLRSSRQGPLMPSVILSQNYHFSSLNFVSKSAK